MDSMMVFIHTFPTFFFGDFIPIKNLELKHINIEMLYCRAMVSPILCIIIISKDGIFIIDYANQKRGVPQ